MKWGSNAGYAITALERLFFEVCLVLADGDGSRVHFAYAELKGGPPEALPPGFSNVVVAPVGTSPDAIRRISDVVSERGIEFVLVFDMQPVHPMYRALRRSGVKAIVSYWGAPISSPMPRWKLALKRGHLLLSRSRADGLVFESRSMAGLAMGGRGVPESMIDIVPLGVDTSVFCPSASEHVYEVFGLPRNRKVIVYSGHCTPRKGIGVLVEAAIELLVRRKRRDVCFVICGDRSDESLPFRQMYEGLGIESWIRFAGYRRDMLPIFQSAFCGVIPSSGWDSFTLSAVEMAASGLPVIASRLQGLAEAVIDGETGMLFEPGNAGALADALVALLEDEDRAHRLGAAGRARCEAELNVDTQRQRLLGAIRRRLRT